MHCLRHEASWSYHSNLSVEYVQASIDCISADNLNLVEAGSAVYFGMGSGFVTWVVLGHYVNGC